MAEYSGPQRSNESDAEYMRRMSRVNREMERIRAEQRKLDRLEGGAAAERERRAEAADNRELDKSVRELLSGFGLDDIQEQYRKGKLTDPRIEGAIQDVKKAQRGRATGARNRRTQKALKKHKKVLKDAGKQAKKNQGCAVIAVALLGATGGIGWAIYETGSAIVSALGG